MFSIARLVFGQAPLSDADVLTLPLVHHTKCLIVSCVSFARILQEFLYHGGVMVPEAPGIVRGGYSVLCNSDERIGCGT